MRPDTLDHGVYRHRRKLDWVYIVFMGVHLLASVLVDGQIFYPEWLVPDSLRKVKADYLSQSHDSVVGGLGSPNLAWFYMAVVLELLWQCPAFVAGMWYLFHDDWRVWPLLIGYSSLAFSSTLFVLWHLVAGPEAASLSAANLQFLLQNYVPFLLVPLLMLVDLTVRCTLVLQRAQSNAAPAPAKKIA
ncbi:unnamed protein product [Parajaminaea phylloscopi]